MGNFQTKININKINFEDVQNCINSNTNNIILLNTLPTIKQSCLIYNTLNYLDEEDVVNTIINNNKSMSIYIYGLNYADSTVYNKYDQLCSLGLENVYIYPGGLFEWLLLQDIYGCDNFKTTTDTLDILQFKPTQNTNYKSIAY